MVGCGNGRSCRGGYDVICYSSMNTSSRDLCAGGSRAVDISQSQRAHTTYVPQGQLLNPKKATVVG